MLNSKNDKQIKTFSQQIYNHVDSVRLVIQQHSKKYDLIKSQL